MRILLSTLFASVILLALASVLPSRCYSQLLEIQINFKGYSGRCMGSLIGPKTILTAAHCVDKAKSIQILSGCKDCKVRAWKKEKGYELFVQRDLALIKLRRAASEQPYGVSESVFNDEYIIKPVAGKPGDSGMPLIDASGIIGVLSFGSIDYPAVAYQTIHHDFVK